MSQQLLDIENATEAVSELAPSPGGRATHPLRVLLLISNLEYGGAQRQVIEIANHLNRDGHHVHIASLSDYTPLAAELHKPDDCLHIIPKRHRFDFSVVPRIARLMRALGTQVLHSFLIDAEIAGRLAGRRCKDVAVIGSERNSNYTRQWKHRLALYLTRGRFDRIVANSQAGRQFQMRDQRVPEGKLDVVYNGVDIDKFRPGAGGAVRRDLGFDTDTPLVGMFASFKKQKNHAMFFRMAKRVLTSCPRAHFLCVGESLHGGLQSSDTYRQEMQSIIEREGLSQVVHCLGNRDDVADVYRACDVTVLTSYREGTPNVLLESMACGVPVVATCAADNQIIVPDGEVGFVVDFDDDQAAADRVIQLLRDQSHRQTLGAAARKMIEDKFATVVMAGNMEAVYRAALQARRAAAGGESPAMVQSAANVHAASGAPAVLTEGRS